ncbi:MAG: hypothetical protein KAR20_24015 [Candidatus Heimdallarchaeota archaeon]|nr:hypothetical protein [Candidatus Heimdallarchaeota archaeon]
MTEQTSLPSILLEIVKVLEAYLEKLFPNRERTLPIKQRDRGINSILTWNIYPRSPEEVNDIFDSIQNLLGKKLVDFEEGELLMYEISEGRILDSGSDAFLISRGFSWDLYIYQPEIFVYIRLLQEKKIETDDNEWISVDIDLIRQSAWFVD